MTIFSAAQWRLLNISLGWAWRASIVRESWLSRRKSRAKLRAVPKLVCLSKQQQTEHARPATKFSVSWIRLGGEGQDWAVKNLRAIEPYIQPGSSGARNLIQSISHSATLPVWWGGIPWQIVKRTDLPISYCIVWLRMTVWLYGPWLYFICIDDPWLHDCVTVCG